MSTTTRDITQATLTSGVIVPDSKLAREATELVRDTEPTLLFNHSTRVYYFASLAGKRRGLKFDPELLYTAAMFHDMGLTPRYSSKSDRLLALEGDANHYDQRLEDDHWEQPGNLFRLMTPEPKQLLFDNTERAINGASQEVLERHIGNCRR